MCDGNINLLEYGKFDGTTHFVDKMNEHNLAPIISRPARITSYTATLIDHYIFTNSCQSVTRSWTDRWRLFCIFSSKLFVSIRYYSILFDTIRYYSIFDIFDLYSIFETIRYSIFDNYLIFETIRYSIFASIRYYSIFVLIEYRISNSSIRYFQYSIFDLSDRISNIEYRIILYSKTLIETHLWF